MNMICLEGTVISGKGEGTKFMKLPWVKKQAEEKLGFTPSAGTLNLRLSRECVELRKKLNNTNSIEILPAQGFRIGKCFRALMHGLECAVVVPEIPEYPDDVIEIIAASNLRKKLQLADGDVIEVKIRF